MKKKIKLTESQLTIIENRLKIEEDSTTNGSSKLYNKIQNILKDNTINHAELIDAVWGKGSKDDAGK